MVLEQHDVVLLGQNISANDSNKQIVTDIITIANEKLQMYSISSGL